MSGGPRLSIRLVVTAATVAIVAAAVLLVGAVAERNLRRALTREAEARLLVEARNLALTGAGALLSELPELTLQPVVRELSESRAEIAFAVVLDHRGVVQGHRDVRALGSAWAMPDGLAPAPTEARLRADERLLASRALLVAEAPVSGGGQRLGRAIVALDRGWLERTVAAARRAQIALVAAVLGAGVLVALLLLGALLRPVAALRAGLERIGRGDLDTPIGSRDRTELGLLASAVDDMAVRLKAARADMLERERLAREVELARDIQQRLLPTSARHAGDFTLRGAHRAAAEVGGDYVDVLDLPDGRLAVTIADVAGKGLGGCLVMSMLAALLRPLRAEHRSPSRLLVALEAHLLATLRPGEFVTMFYGVLDPATGRLEFASAGHTPLLVWRATTGACEWMATRGIPLGAMRGALERTLEDRALTLAPGDLVFQFTDGYNEAEDAAGEPFGFDRIEAVVGAHAARGADAVVAALADALAAWSGDRPPQDDQTVLAVARAVAAADAADEGTLATLDPVAAVADAEARGVAIALPASLEALDDLAPWLDSLPELAARPSAERVVVETTLYELCANVVEHGAAGADATLDLWWVPAAGPAPAGSSLRAGRFVLRDRGFPFRPGRRRPFDPARHEAWRRGRGLGLDLVHLAVREVVFRPGTVAGNVTLLAFDPGRATSAERSVSHV